MELRNYQIEISKKGKEILNKYKLLYLAMEVRTGKTLTALEIAKDYTNILFITKKKAISSIQNDYNNLNPGYKITIINYESLHKIEKKDFDLLIIDEAHKLGTFPKPNKSVKELKKYNLPIIYLSGTPTPESNSQIYHQFFISENSPFIKYKNFYSWFKDFGTLKQIKTSYGFANDYSDSKKIDIPFMLSFTQKEAGFETEIKENILYVKMKDETYKLINKLKKDKVIEGKEEVILGDTGVKLMQKTHQLYSGTIKFESGNTKIIDYSKGFFIKEYFKGKKIGIFYKFKAELELLQEVFLEDLTTDIEIFKTTNKNIALQIVSGREGISLKEADYLVFFNIDFSATSYWQARDRLTTKERLNNNIYWIFSKNGIEEKIYEVVKQKKDFTLDYFKKIC